MTAKKKRSRAQTARDRVRRAALAYPEAHEDFPWGECAIKVRGKVFAFLGGPDDEVRFGLKLPQSAAPAAGLPFAEPMAYALGKSGWITAKFKLDEEPPVDLLLEWLDESYRAVAPKRLVALLPELS